MLKQDFTGKMFRKAKQNVPEHKFSSINHRVLLLILLYVNKHLKHLNLLIVLSIAN